jgi:hypothetical protein
MGRIGFGITPLLALLLACADDPGDGAQSWDAQTPLPAPHDTGMAPDSGDEAAVIPRDAGSGVEDASIPTPDVQHLDAGPMPPDAGARTQLVVPALWQVLEPAEDPFDDRPAEIHCGAGAAMAELLGGEGSFSVDTGACDYLTVTQGTRRAVAAGELLKVRLWHFDLSAPEPAEAHAAVRVDGLPLLDERIPIPKPGGLITAQLLAPRAIPQGAPVLFHLHNHGANSWSLVEVSAGP